jgi:predicted nucleic acid-binding Zn ribbon protein
MSDVNDMDKKAKMEPFGHALESLLSRLDQEGTRVNLQLAIARSFSSVAGEAIAEHTKKVLFHEGVLTAVMESGIWAQELTFFAEEYKVRINKELGGEVVTSVRFRTHSMR